MEEHHWLPMGSDSWLGTQTSNIFTFNVCYSCLDVIDLYTDVMDPSSLILIQKPSYGRLLTQGM